MTCNLTSKKSIYWKLRNLPGNVWLHLHTWEQYSWDYKAVNKRQLWPSNMPPHMSCSPVAENCNIWKKVDEHRIIILLDSQNHKKCHKESVTEKKRCDCSAGVDIAISVFVFWQPEDWSFRVSCVGWCTCCSVYWHVTIPKRRLWGCRNNPMI